MSIKYMNEAFKRLYESDMVPTDEPDIETKLRNTVDSLINNNEKHIKKFEIALQNVLENEYPEQSWWEVTSVNIFMDLFENRDPYATVDKIVADLKGNIDNEDTIEGEEPVQSDFEESLNEDRNLDNIDINDKIAKALSRKSFARKFEDELKEYGITVQYLDGQGTTLIGPNGKRLSSSRKEIYGPSAPGHNGTHYKGYLPNYRWEERRVKQCQERVDAIQNLLDTMDVSMLAQNYPGSSVEEATNLLRADFEQAISALNDSIEALKREKKRHEDSLHHRHVSRGKGHTSPAVTDTTIEDNVNSSPIDYLTYLTKKPNEIRTGIAPSEHTPNITKYYELDRGVRGAERNLSWDKNYHRVLEPEQIQAKIDDLEKEFEQKIAQLLRDQEYNKKSITKSYERVDNAKKAKRDFLSSLGIN